MNATPGIEQQRTDEPWDCLVVGGGAAGLSSALVLGRARRRTLVVDASEQSNRLAEGIGGLLGHDRRAPGELYRIGREELTAYPSVVIRTAQVVAAVDRGTTFDVELDDGSHQSTRMLLLATGMDYRLPEIPGVAERWGRTVFHCPFCHGWEMRERPLGVLDRSHRAVERALLLRMWSDDVTLYANGSFEHGGSERARLAAAGVDLDERVIEELRGPGQHLDAVVFVDGSERSCEGLLVVAPLRQRSSLAIGLGARVADEAVADGPLAIDAMCRTSVPRLYAAGDLGAHVLPSVATAVAAGSVRGSQPSEHGEVSNVRGEEVRLEDHRGRSDQVVRIVDAAVAATESVRERAGGPADLIVDRRPRERREESLQGIHLGGPHPGE
jgi:thioredoxin reductase